MKYIAHKEVSLDGKVTRYCVLSPAGDFVCSANTTLAAETLAYILNTHGGNVRGTLIIVADWAALNNKEQSAAA